MIQQKNFLIYPHKQQFRLELNQQKSFCVNCSSAIITDKSGKEISTIKPLKYHIPQETSLPIFLLLSDNHNPYSFLNKSGYIKIRKQIIKDMKLFCNKYKLNKKTFFLALDYLDRICSRMLGFDLEAVKQIYQICIILASKLIENQSKVIEIKKLARIISTNYAKDELYLLTLLNYDLKVFTCYDILIDILNCGFIFNDEDFSVRKMHSIYSEIENILYLFSESKYYIDMTHKEIAMAIMGFIRETLGLVAFSNNIQNMFMHEYVDIHNYVNCLNKLRKCFKLKVEDNNKRKNSSDSTADSNSDINSDNASEKIPENKNLGNRNFNSSKKKDN
jgi:hypothetical protein